jgi:hypothetical protein
MPMKGGKAICVCVKLEGNPEWPRKLLITQPKYLKQAQRFAADGDFVPCFVWRRSKQWEYVGDYRAFDSTEDPKKFALETEMTGKVLLVLFLERRDDSESEAEAEAEGFDAQERGAGFQSNPEIRREVEKHAMNRAKEELARLGFSRFEDTSKHKCYDYTCERGGDLHYVEAKGTQGSGASVQLTKNEVAHGQKYQQHSIAVIVHDVKVILKSGSFHASGGIVRVCLPWIIELAALEPVQYRWRVPVCAELPG